MDPPLCTVCQQFFGNPSKENMCSKCFSQQSSAKKNLESLQEVTEKAPQIIEEAKTGPPDRCSQCKKKLNLLPFRCDCGLYFCSNHRQPEQHSCTFDFKTAGIRKLSEENPQIRAEKLNRL